VAGSFQIGAVDLPIGRTAVIPAALASECEVSSPGGTLLEVGLVG
jgi:hypothetical protein